ncbi:MAG TPA: glycosyltransferase family 9 protein [Thermomicrobiales bacterium]|nr:glycosyltransferase family 9 protein [Thermomicrobiales bacterium]
MQRLTAAVRDRLLPAAAHLRPSRWEPTEDTVLIIQPDHLGDILLSQLAVRHLRLRFPDSRLVAVVGPWSREIAEMSWPVDEILTVEFPGFTRERSMSMTAPYRQLTAESQRLRALHPRSAYVLRPDGWWAAWLASLIAPEVVTAADPRTSAFATRTAVVHDGDHASVRAFRIASNGDDARVPTVLSDPLHLTPSPDAVALATRLLRSHRVNGGYVVIHPGSGASVKEWPAQRWRHVASALADAGYSIVLTGSMPERVITDGIARDGTGAVNLAGQTTVPVLTEILRGASLVLGPDCGPLHLAVAADTPSVHLFGPSDPVRYGPWGDPVRHRVISAGWRCPRCGDLSAGRGSGCGCMLAIQPNEVAAVARALLANHAR